MKRGRDRKRAFPRFNFGILKNLSKKHFFTFGLLILVILALGGITFLNSEGGLTGAVVGVEGDLTIQADMNNISMESVSPTPDNNTFVSNVTAEINVTAELNNSLKEFTWIWDSVNYTFYDDSLVLMMNFENLSDLGENSTYVVDLSPRKNNGTVTENATFSENGKYGGGYDFDAGKVGVTSSPDLNFSGEKNFTVFAWVNPRDVSISNQGVIANSDSNGGWNIRVSSNSFYFTVRNSSGTILQTGASISSYENQWVFLTGRFNGTHTTAYRNGEQVASDPFNLGDIGQGFSTTYVGYYQASNVYFNGTVDEVRVYNRSFTDSEIIQFYNSNLQKFNQTYWEFYSNQSDPVSKTSSYYASACDINNECNSTEVRIARICVEPYEDVQFNSNTTLCPGNYYLNDTGGDGVIVMGANNVILDCAGAVLAGNNTTDSIVIYANSKTDITIKNCTIKSYHYGLDMRDVIGEVLDSNFTENRVGIKTYAGGLLNDSNITNNLFYNNSEKDIQLNGATQHDLNIKNNTFYAWSSFSIFEESNSISNNLVIENNSFSQMGSAVLSSIKQNNGSFWIIRNNSFYGNGVISSRAVEIRKGNNSIIEDNYMETSHLNIWLVGAYNITIQNNNISNSDEGSSFRDGTDTVYFYNNTITNMTLNYDSYDLGLGVLNSSNIYIEDNTWTEIGTTSILLQGTRNVTIKNNNISIIAISNRSNYGASDGTDVPCAIKAVQRYKSWFHHFGNDNITIEGNTFDSDTQCFLQLENGTQISHDLTGYWYVSFRTPVYLKGISEFYVSNSFSNLSQYHITQGIRFNIYSNANGGDNPGMRYQIFKDYLYLENVNTSNIFNNSAHNLTNALIYFDNSSVACSDVSTCDNIINLTLPPNNHSYVLNNFNLTEGVNRSKSPIWFSNTSYNEKRIVSNLTDDINATAVFNVSNCSILRIEYISNSSVFQKNYTGSEYSCSDNLVELYVDEIEPAQNSNVLTIMYGLVTPPEGGGGVGPQSTSTSTAPKSEPTKAPTKKAEKEIVEEPSIEQPTEELPEILEKEPKSFFQKVNQVINLLWTSVVNFFQKIWNWF
ncbi:hypothetical protein GOV03_04145 [Candidatus Woesearchaeota archaeon]|nr:hypothetical protein [Candidatus Woesearchaeota archaeon]